MSHLWEKMMRTGQQVQAGESRMPRSASATAGLEVATGTAGAARTGDSVTARPAGGASQNGGPNGGPNGRQDGGQDGRPRRAAARIRLLTAEEVSPLGDIRCWA